MCPATTTTLASQAAVDSTCSPHLTTHRGIFNAPADFEIVTPPALTFFDVADTLSFSELASPATAAAAAAAIASAQQQQLCEQGFEEELSHLSSSAPVSVPVPPVPGAAAVVAVAAPTSTGSNGATRKRKPKNFVPDELKDEKYWARRLKNNAAAARNREEKRKVDSMRTSRLPALDKEKEVLTTELQKLRDELDDLRRVIHTRLQDDAVPFDTALRTEVFGLLSM